MSESFLANARPLFLHRGLGHFHAVALEPSLKCSRFMCRSMVLFPELFHETNPHTWPFSVYGQKSNLSTSREVGCQAGAGGAKGRVGGAGTGS